MPALLTRISMVPNALTAASTMRVTSSASPILARTAKRFAAGLLDGLDGGCGRLLVLDVVDDDLGAFGREAFGDPAAEATARRP